MEIEEKVKEFIELYGRSKTSLMSILHDVQEHFGYIPRRAQELIADELRIPVSDVYGLITFYARFSLVPQGKNKVSICMGTACYVRGAEAILNAVKQSLQLNTGETSGDGLFSIEETRCIGACGLAPIMTVNRDVYGKIKPEQVDEIILKYRTEHEKESTAQ